MATTKINLWEIAPRTGSQDESFEEFCCQLAQYEQRVPPSSTFTRLRGAGGDGGVECYYVLPDGTEWGWQAKFIPFDGLKAALDRSIKTSLTVHPKLSRYIICIPFDLTGPTQKKGKSQKEKFDEYVDEWERLASRKKLRCEFELWSASILLDRLHSIDHGGGRKLFWFNETFITDSILNTTIEKAVSVAGPRYTADLNIDVPLGEAIEALGQSELWKDHLLAKRKSIRKFISDWGECVQRLPSEMRDDFPESLRSKGTDLTSILKSIDVALSKIIEVGLNEPLLQQLIHLFETSSKTSDECSNELEKDLVQKHGANAPKSVNFRQFNAEYMVSFPAQNYDACKKLCAALASSLAWAKSPHLAAICKQSVIILGEAGSGKTHSLCYAAINRLKNGLSTCLVLGEQICENSFWRSLAEKLGLPTDTSLVAVLDAMNCRGQASGKPLLIIIDGINETKPDRFRWLTWLPEIQIEISKRPWLRFIASCRSSYRSASIPQSIDMGEFEHKGFEGFVTDACNKFFTHYQLNLPTDPMLHPEFENPLFLKLLCKVMQSQNMKTLPLGWTGFYQVYVAFMPEINRKFCRSIDSAEENRYVHKATTAFAKKCSDVSQDYLTWSGAQEVVESILPTALRNGKLLEFLISENALRTDGWNDDKEEEIIRISFEKLSDYLIAEFMLEPYNSTSIKQAFLNPSQLGRLVKNRETMLQNRGICEAMSTILPEQYNEEFCVFIDNAECEEEGLKCLVESLKFRSPDRISAGTIYYINKALSCDICYTAMDTLLALSTREMCQANAIFLDKILRDLSSPRRDAFWCTYTHLRYEERGVVYLLCNQPLALSPKALPTKSVIYLWAIVLLWFCSSADRRVRDTATKALVALTQSCPEVWLELLEFFLNTDDDYILERALASCYGALLRNPLNPRLQELGWFTYFKILKNASSFQNACVLDHARAITYMAMRSGLLGTSISNKDISPPYSSDWPLSFESKASIKTSEGADERLPKLFQSCFEDDFFTYTISHALGAYEKTLSKEQMASWVFSEAMRLADGDQGVIHYDKVICSRFGRGRGRVKWAERIGKKYQWIALRRLIARVACNCQPEISRWSSKPKQHPLLFSNAADIDPSILIKSAAKERLNPDCWWNKNLYTLKNVENMTDKDWIAKIDFPDPRKLIGPHCDSQGNNWIILESHPDWRLVEEGEGDIFDKKYRDMWLQIRSYFVPTSSLLSLMKMLKAKSLVGRWMTEGMELHEGYIGEYPWGVPFNCYEDEYREYNMEPDWKGQLLPSANSLTINYGYDCFQESPINILLPSRNLYEFFNLNWNGIDGFSSEGTDVFKDPSVLETGPSTLLMRKDNLDTFLARNGLSIVWTLLGEKIASKSHDDFLRLEYSNHAILQNDALKVMKPKVK